MNQKQSKIKPRIKVFRDKDTLWWACNAANKYGFGITPAIAYKNWARQMPLNE